MRDSDWRLRAAPNRIDLLRIGLVRGRTYAA